MTANQYEPYVTIPVTTEMESLKRYLSTQPSDLQVTFDSTVPGERYVIPDSLVLIVQQAQRNSLYPLHISISFLKHTVDISYTIHPRQTHDERFPDIDKLVSLYRKYSELPTIQQTNDRFFISIPLFI